MFPLKLFSVLFGAVWHGITNNHRHHFLSLSNLLFSTIFFLFFSVAPRQNDAGWTLFFRRLFIVFDLLYFYFLGYHFHTVLKIPYSLVHTLRNLCGQLRSLLLFIFIIHYFLVLYICTYTYIYHVCFRTPSP